FLAFALFLANKCVPRFLVTVFLRHANRVLAFFGFQTQKAARTRLRVRLMTENSETKTDNLQVIPSHARSPPRLFDVRLDLPKWRPLHVSFADACSRVARG